MLNQEALKELLQYDPDTGIFTWIGYEGGKAVIGKRAGTIDSIQGYRIITFEGKRYSCARLAWLYVYGDWPKHSIDHINGIRDDNRIANLRDVSLTDNQRNRRLNENNNSGVTGVSWYAARQKWRACITGNGKRIYKSFVDFDEACAWRKAKEQELGYHPNHGK